MTKHFERRADIPTPTNAIITEDVEADGKAITPRRRNKGVF